MTDALPEITVGVVTHDRAALFADTLVHLRAAIEHYGAPVKLVVVNNSGAPSRALVESIIQRSAVRRGCEVSLIDSPRNDLSIARNLILDACRTRLLAFIDDDENPRPGWLGHLVRQQARSDSAAVAGPILPVYPAGTPRWVQAVDLHNTAGRRSGETVRRAASGNCLLDMERVGQARFDVAFGRSGGEDGDFFERLARSGERMVWSEQAVVEETIVQARTTTRYVLFRFMKQGSTFARFMLRDAGGTARAAFYARALLLAPIGILGGLLLRPFNPGACARWWKGGFTNLGKLLDLEGSLYG